MHSYHINVSKGRLQTAYIIIQWSVVIKLDLWKPLRYPIIALYYYLAMCDQICFMYEYEYVRTSEYREILRQSNYNVAMYQKGCLEAGFVFFS